MNYEQFIAEIQKYWDLRSKGLKKQANGFLFDFVKRFQEDVSEADADTILFQFCKEYLDEMKFPGKNQPRRHLPFQLAVLLHGYLDRACGKDKMPQMRWAFQISGAGFKPSGHEEDASYHILERAYRHAECDQQTVDLYFNELLEDLFWGQHHFPEYCLITREKFNHIVEQARKILSEKTVDTKLTAEFAYYEKLYHIYFEWQENGGNGDFYALCEKEGLEFEGIPAFYYEK